MSAIIHLNWDNKHHNLPNYKQFSDESWRERAEVIFHLVWTDTVLHCHMEILCLPAERLATLMRKGSVICPQTCSRAELPWYSAQPAVPGGSSAWMPLLPAGNYMTRRKKKEKKRIIKRKKGDRKKSHNRKRKETWRTLQRPGADSGSTPSPPHPSVLTALCGQTGGYW